MTKIAQHPRSSKSQIKQTNKQKQTKTKSKKPLVPLWVYGEARQAQGRGGRRWAACGKNARGGLSTSRRQIVLAKFAHHPQHFR
jgi:hypothetical protein